MAEIRQAREARLHASRMVGSKLRERRAGAKQLEQEIHLVQAAPELAAPAVDVARAKKLKVAVALSKKTAQAMAE